MNIKTDKVFVTSALPYTNSTPHCGNLIGSTLSADVYVRALKKCGKDVMFVCGSDSFGSQTEIKAKKEGLTCDELCDKYKQLHKNVYDWFNIDFNVFGETPTETHVNMSQQIFRNLWENGMLFENVSDQYFCNECDMFLSDRFMNGHCYHNECNGIVKGNECDKCNKFIDADKLTEKWCSNCKSIPEKRETKHLYMTLEKFKGQLSDYFLSDDNANGCQYMSPAAKRLTKEWLSKDLQDRSVTRDIKFAVKVPELDGLDGYENKTIMPWLDAPIGYMSILAHEFPQEWESWINCGTWVQFMAKDNVPFHTIIFPITLTGSNFMGLKHGVTHLSATEYLLYSDNDDPNTETGEKFSKSDGVGIFGDQVMQMSKLLDIDEDYWRYYLIKLRPENSDSVFTFSGFCDVIKGELAQKMGNLINRGYVMCNKYYNKPEVNYDFTNFPVIDDLLLLINTYVESINSFSFRGFVNVMNRIVEIGNSWIELHKLYNVCKDFPVENEHLMGNLLFIIWLFAEVAEPVMPTKSKKIKTYFRESTTNNSTTQFSHIIDIINQKQGKMSINLCGQEKLFNQVKLKDIYQINANIHK
jgi:methionyl-tRNA synthetase